MDEIEITPTVQIKESELAFDYLRASGPGGQNVNKVASAVQLRFDAAQSPSLPEDIRLRLLQMAGQRATREGVIIIEARQYRTQEQNRDAARKRLVELIRRAVEPPKPRIHTRPSGAARRKRLEDKRMVAERKRQRGRITGPVEE